MARKPKGAGAVMAAHAPEVVQADDPQTALYRKLNYFPTPPWAARAGGQLIQVLDPGRWLAWEPACGEGHAAFGLKDTGFRVFGTDIHDHGSEWQERVVDFLTPEADGVEVPDWIITNPPFALAAEFVEVGLRRARRGVAMLCRMSWLESAGRYPLFFGETPLTVLAPFAERVPMQLGSWDPKGSTATGYAWFIWMHRPVAFVASERFMALGGSAPVIIPIPPGTRDRLTRPDDARRFGVKAAAPLFEGGGF